MYATLVSIIDHANPSNPPFLVLDGATSSETTAIDVLEDLDNQGFRVVAQTSFDLTSETGTATFVSTLLRA